MKLATFPLFLIAALLATLDTARGQMAWELLYDDPELLPRAPTISCANDGNCTAVGASYNIDFFPSVIRTTDGGRFWTSQPHGLPFIEYAAANGSGLTVQLYDVAMIDSARAVVVGAQGAIIRTSDAGQSWIREDSLTDVALTTVSFSGPLNGLAASAVRNHDTIYVTTDGGVSWTPRQIGTLGFDEVYAITPARMIALQVPGGGGSFVYTSNAGATWTTGRFPISGLIQRSWYPSYSFVDSLRGFAAAVISTGGGTLDMVFRTTNGGANWTSVYAQPVSGGGMLGIRFTDTSTGIAVTKLGAIYRTTDGGATWERSVPNPFDLLGGQSLISLSFVGRNIYGITTSGRFLAYHNTSTSAIVGLESGSSSRLHLYPNPASATITVELPEELALHEGPARATIVDALGTEVRRLLLPVEGAGVRLDVMDLPPGVYNVRIGVGEDVVTGGFVVR